MASESSAGCVGDFFDLVNGYAFKSADFIESGVRVIKIKNVKAGVFSEHEFSYVNESFLTSRRDKVARSGDLLISMSGNRHDGSPETWVGKVAFFEKDEPHLINQRVGALRLKKGAKVVPRFAGYVLSAWNYQQHFIAVATSSGGQANLSPSQILGVPFSLPPWEDQVAISDFVGSIDDRIDNLRKANTTLEAIAQALFKSWFVDFDPVRAKVEGLAPKGMDAATADLFPSEFEDSELGPIPKGWHCGRLGDVLELIVERAKAGPETAELPYVPIEAIPSKSVFLGQTMPGELAQSSLVLFHDRDILFGAMRPYFHKVAMAPFKGVTRTTVLVLRAGVSAHAFALFVASQASTIEFATTNSHGTTIPYVKWTGVLDAMPLVIPSVRVIEAFGNIVESMLSVGTSSAHRQQVLTALRDTLLPHLISGRLRLSEAQATVEEALV